jgi:hypothetical protein
VWAYDYRRSLYFVVVNYNRRLLFLLLADSRKTCTNEIRYMIVHRSSISEPTPLLGDAASGNVQRSNSAIAQSCHVNDNDSFYSVPISTLGSHHHVLYSVYVSKIYLKWYELLPLSTSWDMPQLLEGAHEDRKLSPFQSQFIRLVVGYEHRSIGFRNV